LERTAGIFLVALPVIFNLFFLLLGRSFGYPDILRQPTAEILRRFQIGGTPLRLVWHGFTLTAVGLAPLAILVSQVFGSDDLAIVPVATLFGVLAAIVQFLGLIRWPYLVSYLARAHQDPTTTPAKREMIEVVFQAFHHSLGVAIGEHLGYLFTGLWTMLISVAMIQSTVFDAWLGWGGMVVGFALVVGSAEFSGPFEETGWNLAGKIVPIAYGLWSLWLMVAGVMLLIG
jgi:uncharacterized protein DUF4386